MSHHQSFKNSHTNIYTLEQTTKGLASGECVRISTGATVPAGADAVVQVEDTELLEVEGNEESSIQILVAPSFGQNIRGVGSDIKQGDLMMLPGTKIGPSELGLLASTGNVSVACHQRPKVGVMSTGNEVTESIQNGSMKCVRVQSI